MADILAVASEQTDRPAGHRDSRKWSPLSSGLAIIGLSLLGWALIGGAWKQFPIF